MKASAKAATSAEFIPRDDRRRGLSSLTLAFVADPVMRWAWPDAHRYTTYWPQFADGFGGRAFDQGTAYGLEDCVAVALWLPPGIEPDEETVMAGMRESMDDQ